MSSHPCRVSEVFVWTTLKKLGLYNPQTMDFFNSPLHNYIESGVFYITLKCKNCGEINLEF